jgi:hypothetical protein
LSPVGDADAVLDLSIEQALQRRRRAATRRQSVRRSAIMATTTVKKVPATRPRTPASKVPLDHTSASTTIPAIGAVKPALDTTAKMSESVLKSVEAAQKAAIEAVRTFVDTVDEVIPVIGEASRREHVIDAALDMADKLVTTQYEFLSAVVRSADRSVTGTAMSSPRPTARAR